MRYLGTVGTAAEAERFVSYLLTQSLDAIHELKSPAGTEHDIWVRDEDALPRARQEFEAFVGDPTAKRYTDAVGAAREMVQQRSNRAAEAARLLRRMPKTNLPTSRTPAGPITKFLTAAVIVVTLTTGFNRPQPKITVQNGEITIARTWADRLMFVDPIEYAMAVRPDPLASIKQGEVWRFFTPALMHGSLTHVVFNLLSLYFLGSLCEQLYGKRTYLLVILVSHAIGACLQALVPESFGSQLGREFGGSPFFVGLSGVVYGIFGYVWMRPGFTGRPPVLPGQSVFMMMAWFFVGWLPIGMHVANWAHLGGLLGGALLATLLPRR